MLQQNRISKGLPSQKMTRTTCEVDYNEPYIDNFLAKGGFAPNLNKLVFEAKGDRWKT